MFRLKRARRSKLVALLSAAILGSAAFAPAAQTEDRIAVEIPSSEDFLEPKERSLADRFHRLFTTRTRGVMVSKWFGILTWQHPFDLWITQEIMTEVKPDVIVEAGTFRGGSAIIWATMLRHINPEGSVITIDIEDKRVPRAKQMPISREKVKFLLGSSTAPEIVAEVKKRTKGKKVLLILDSLHTRDHVLDELRAYWDMVEVGDYIIVQDSAINGHPVAPWWGPGPWEAVRDFLAENDHFVVDKSRERYLIGNNTNGFLKRVR